MSYGDTTTWWTFGGKLLNSAIAAKFDDLETSVKFDDLSISFPRYIDPIQAKAMIDLIGQEGDDQMLPQIDDEFIAELKFNECLPGGLMSALLFERFDVLKNWSRLSSVPSAVVRTGREQ